MNFTLIGFISITDEVDRLQFLHDRKHAIQASIKTRESSQLLRFDVDPFLEDLRDELKLIERLTHAIISRDAEKQS